MVVTLAEMTTYSGCDTGRMTRTGVWPQLGASKPFQVGKGGRKGTEQWLLCSCCIWDETKGMITAAGNPARVIAGVSLGARRMSWWSRQKDATVEQAGYGGREEALGKGIPLSFLRQYERTALLYTCRMEAERTQTPNRSQELSPGCTASAGGFEYFRWRLSISKVNYFSWDVYLAKRRGGRLCNLIAL